jgi:hypothetical protein
VEDAVHPGPYAIVLGVLMVILRNENYRIKLIHGRLAVWLMKTLTSKTVIPIVLSSPLIVLAFVALLALNAPAFATNCWYSSNVSNSNLGAGSYDRYSYTGVNQLYSDLNSVSPTGYAMYVGYYYNGVFTYSAIGAGGHGPEFQGSDNNVQSEYYNIQSFSVSYTGTDHYSQTYPGTCPQISGR